MKTPTVLSHRLLSRIKNFTICACVAITASVSHAEILEFLHSFAPDVSDGGHPFCGLTQGNDGYLYGTAPYGGSTGFNAGTIFRIAPDGSFSTFIVLDGTYGYQPAAGLTLGRDGNFYGANLFSFSGGNGAGTFFKVTTNGTVSTVAVFNPSRVDGAWPQGDLLLSSTGDFYGVTETGGANNDGTIYKLKTNGTLSVIYHFTAADGGYTRCKLVEGPDGALYGTCINGGNASHGSIYRVTTNGVFTTLVNMNGNSTGGTPLGGLILANDGNFYGVTAFGGAYGYGLLYRMTTNGVYLPLSSFTGTNGASSYASLIQARDGNLYGTTQSGGTNASWGTVFKSTLNGDITSLYQFGFTNGGSPYGPLVQGNDGNIYGTTYYGGPGNNGIVFRIPLTPIITVQPVGQTNNPGATVTLTVTAINNVTSYQWRHNGTSLAGATTSSLTLVNVQTTNWAGHYDVIVSNPTTTLTSAVANVGVYSAGAYKSSAGIYNGLFYETNAVKQQSSGFFTMKLGTNGAYSGKLTFDGDVLSFAGIFPVNGFATLNIARAQIDKPDLTMKLDLNLSLWVDQITGCISAPGAWTANIIADRTVFSKTNITTAYATNYTMLIPGGSNAVSGPTGYGYATISVNTNGTVTTAGGLADGTALSQAMPISKNGTWPVYVPLYKSTRVYTNYFTTAVVTNKSYCVGSLLGWLTIWNQAPVGTISWIKGGWTNTTYYTNGFTNVSSVLGSLYTTPPKGTRALNITTNGTLVLTNGNLTTALTRTVSLSTNNAFTVSPTNNVVKLTSFTAKTGLIVGSFKHPDNNNIVTKISGVVLQQQNMAGGFFVGTNQTGKMLLSP